MKATATTTKRFSQSDRLSIAVKAAARNRAQRDERNARLAADRCQTCGLTGIQREVSCKC